MLSRLLGRVRLTSTMEVLTGLHIGAGQDTIEIGGIDNPVIKHPITGQPYVPGSSIKGKLRFLLEWAFGTIRADGHPWGFNEDQDPLRPDDPVLRIFGTPAKREAWSGGPTRLIVRDAALDEGGATRQSHTVASPRRRPKSSSTASQAKRTTGSARAAPNACPPVPHSRWRSSFACSIGKATAAHATMTA